METIAKMDREVLLAKWANVIDATADIRTWTSGHELAWLCEVATKHEKMIEIGSYYGRSAKCMMLANPDLQLTCYDNCENREVPEVFAKNLKDQIREGRVILREGDSRLLQDYHGSVSAIFIDAGHRFEDVMLDIENARSVLFPGGLLCGHDWRINDPTDGVNRAVIASLGQPAGLWESLWWVTL